MNFQTATLSKAGGRRENQDACDYVVLATYGCWMLGDGLGGHGGGSVAARIAVDTVLAAFRASPASSPEALGHYLEAANSAICDGQKQRLDLAGMRTTAVLLVTDSQSARWAHVGDSRLYYFHDQRIQYQTSDHSVPQVLFAAGEISAEQIRFHEGRNRLLRSLGSRDGLRMTVQEAPQPIGSGDAFLLCSDGFWEYVLEPEMEVDLARTSGAAEWLQAMEARLQRQAAGAHDNYSAVVVRVIP